MAKQTSGSKQNKDKEPTVLGRPSIKTDALLDKIIERIALGENNVTICRDPEMPSRSTLHEWLSKDKAFSDKYTQAKEFGGDVTAQSMIELASKPIPFLMDNPKAANADIQHRKLQIDVLKFLLGKWYPRKYGDKVQIDLDSVELSIESAKVKDLTLKQLKEFVDNA